MTRRSLAMVSFLTATLVAACGPDLDAEDLGGVDASVLDPLDAAADASATDTGFGMEDGADAGLDATVDAGPPVFEPSWSPSAGTPPVTHPGRWGAVTVWDAEQRRLILHGGSRYPFGDASDTWVFDLDSEIWSELATIDAPEARYCHCGAYLPETRELLIINGRNSAGPVTAGAYTLDLNSSTWAQISGEVPDGLIGCQAVYDPIRGRVVVFGGASRRGPSSTTWIYDPVERKFRSLEVDPKPPGRRDANMVYDPSADRMLLFGGQVGATSHLNDVWAFDGTDWSQLATNDGPSPRRWGSSAMDAHGRWLVFGGTNEAAFFDDLWLFDTSSSEWSQLDLPGAPPARAGAGAAFVGDRDALILFGGLDLVTAASLEDGWTLRWYAD